MALIVLFWLSSAYVIFFGAIGFLFGQVFSGHFEVGATVAGVSGILAACLAQVRNGRSSRTKYLIVGCCTLGIVGVFLDAFNYYAKYDTPGNYYAWVLIGPYCAALICIGYVVSRRT
jgi:hypothetical protein